MDTKTKRTIHRGEMASLQHCCFVFPCCCCWYLENWYLFKRQKEREIERKAEIDREEQAFWGTGSCVSISVLLLRVP